MQFNDTTNLTGIIQRCEDMVFGGQDGAISGNTKLLKKFTGYINTAKDRIITKILASDTRWQYDDSTYTDYPTGTTNLYQGQQSYVLSTDQLKITGFEVMTSDGTFKVLYPIDQRDVRDNGISQSEFMKTEGTPEYYDIIGDSVFLYPIPNADRMGGLKSSYQRGANQYVYTDTDAETGIPSNFDSLIPLMASYEYAKYKEMDGKANRFKSDILEQEEDLQDFFNRRDKDEKPQLRARRRNFK